MLVALVVLFGFAAGSMFLSWGHFRRYGITRPPVGVFNLWDVALMIGGIALLPYLYLCLPRWLVTSMLAAGVLSGQALMWEPLLRARRVIWMAVISCIGVEGGVMLGFGALSRPFFAINDVALTLAIVGITNLWAQSGMSARAMATLAGVLAIYDAIATWQLPLMADLVRRVAELPFAPLIAWPVSNTGAWVAIGLGDLLIATGFPLVMRKAFGRVAGITATAAHVCAIGVLLALVGLGILQAAFPVLIVLGPLVVLQYGYWRRRQGRERTMLQYLRAEPIPLLAHESMVSVQGVTNE